MLFDVRNTSGIWSADDRAELGDRDLVVGEDLEQQRLGLDLDTVDLVDQQDDRILGADGLEQRTGEQEVVGEDVLLDLVPATGPGVVGLRGLDAEQLLLVVPLVQRLGLVEPLVALEPDQAGADDLGDRLGELGLAGSGGTLDQDRLAEAVGQVDDAGDALVGEVVDLAEPVADVVDSVEPERGPSRASAAAHRVRIPTDLTGRSIADPPAGQPVRAQGTRRVRSWPRPGGHQPVVAGPCLGAEPDAATRSATRRDRRPTATSRCGRDRRWNCTDRSTVRRDPLRRERRRMRPTGCGIRREVGHHHQPARPRAPASSMVGVDGGRRQPQRARPRSGSPPS